MKHLLLGCMAAMLFAPGSANETDSAGGAPPVTSEPNAGYDATATETAAPDNLETDTRVDEQTASGSEVEDEDGEDEPGGSSGDDAE